MKAYESELTGFLRTLKQERPQIDELQREGRALWWDKDLDADQLARWKDSRVRQSPYVYYPLEPIKPASDS